MRFLSSRLVLAVSLATIPSLWGMDLQEAFLAAEQHDASWLATQEQLRASVEGEQQARSALLPNFSAQSAISGNHINPAEPIPSFGLYDRTFTSKSYGIQAMQPLFNAGIWRGYHQAQALTSQAKAEFEATRQNFILQVATAYFSVLRAQESLAYASAEQQAIGRQLEQTRKRFEVGMASITEVHEAQAAFDTSVADRIGALSLVSTAQAQLDVLTGGSSEHLAILGNDAPVHDAPKEPESFWVHQAETNNPQIIADQFAYKAAQASTQQHRAEYFPTLNLVSQWQHVNTGGADPLQDGNNAMIGVQLNVPLYSGGAIPSRVRQALALEYAARDRLDFAKRQAEQQTHASYLLVQTDAARVKARQQAVSSSQMALVATQAGYDVGTRDIVEVMQAQKDLYAARSAYANARYDYVLDGLKLKASAGLLSDMDIRQLNSWLDDKGSININSLNPELQAPVEQGPNPVIPKGTPTSRRHS